MFEKLKTFYNKYNIPKENLYESYALSISKLNVIFKAMAIFCIFETILTFVSPTMAQEMGGDIRVYYVLFGAFMFIGICATLFWKSHKGENRERDIIVARVIVICTAIFFGLLTVYEAFTFDNPHNVIAVCVIIFIAVLFLVEVNPILYISIEFILITINLPTLYNVYNNASMIVNSYLFLITTGFASYSFQTKELNRLKYLKELKEYTKVIESKVKEETIKRTQLQDDIIFSMADLVENRDIDTGEHIKRTSLYVELIAEKAREMGFYTDEIDNDFIEYLKKAMPLHDIGKIVIPDSILKAPRKLTKEEFEIMKTHASKGAEIIETLFANLEEEDYISYASNIAKFHHEWWNGKGYPCNYKHENIPLVARIAAIADVFDALVSSRCYKSAYTVEDALKLMKAEKGTHFDPKLFDAFVAAMPDIMKVAELNK